MPLNISEHIGSANNSGGGNTGGGNTGGNVTANPGPELLKTVDDGSALIPGEYQTDSTGGAFALTLGHVYGGRWCFEDLGPAGTNTVTIGTATDLFLYQTSVIAGPVEVDVAFAEITITGLPTAGEYKLTREA